MDQATCLSAVAPEGASWFRIPAEADERRRLTTSLRALASGTPVVLVDDRPGARRRSRTMARDGAVAVERELLAIPSAADPVYAVEDVPAALRAFWRSFVTVPPGEAGRAPMISAAVRTVAVLRPWPILGAVVPGRFTIGHRR
jgi:hypothetical protein